jgi:hypothetical protein
MDWSLCQFTMNKMEGAQARLHVSHFWPVIKCWVLRNICIEFCIYVGSHNTQMHVHMWLPACANALASKSCDHWQSVSQFALVSNPFWDQRPDFCYWQTVAVLSMWDALSSERSSLSFTAAITSSTYHLYLLFYMLAFYIVSCHGSSSFGYLLFTDLHVSLVCMHVWHIQRPCQSRLGAADHAPNSCSSCYNRCLVTWTVMCLTTTKLKPLIFSVSGFAISNVTNDCIFMMLYYFCLLPAQFHSIIMYSKYSTWKAMYN